MAVSARKPVVAHPVAALQEQATQLDAAMTLCLADPSPGPVHAIRKATRRIEAQLELLALLPDIPEHASRARKLRKRLAGIRGAAGKVRDLDVLRDKLTDRGQEPGLWETGSQKQLRQESGDLEKRLKQRRKKKAEALVHALEKSQRPIALALEEMRDAVKPAEDLSLPPEALMDLATRWFEGHRPSLDKGTLASDDAMHGTRKTAKLARYLLESAPEEARNARQLAARFEDLQEAGGHWHDLLMLAEEARKRLGKDSLLARQGRRLRDETLEEFRGRLDLLETPASPEPPSRSVPRSTSKR